MDLFYGVLLVLLFVLGVLLVLVFVFVLLWDAYHLDSMLFFKFYPNLL